MVLTMKIIIPKEIMAAERRVACTPAEASQLHALGYTVIVESGAGLAAGHADATYRASGATIGTAGAALWQAGDIICKVNPPAKHPQWQVAETSLVTAGKTLISLFNVGHNAALCEQVATAGGSVIALDAMPRISRAQKMDVLSAMANVAGYRAVIEAGQHLPRFFAGQITAAGRVAPAKVLVIGAGVAGLSAIGTAVSLGAMVRAFDTRPQVKQQVESLGAQFLELTVAEDGGGQGGYAKVMSKAFIAAEMELFAAQSKEVDIIITTALIPGQPAPKLISTAMVESMPFGSVVIDMAAAQGGNCEATVADEIVTVGGATVVGLTDYPSRMAAQSSQLFATNVRHLLTELTPHKDGQLVLDMTDEVVRGCTVVHNGERLPPPPKPTPVPIPAASAAETTPVTAAETVHRGRTWRAQLGTVVAWTVGLAAILGVGAVAPESFMRHFTVFVLACLVGWQVIWNVTPALHTPLMSVTNAISGIIIIGAMLQVSTSNVFANGLAVIAVAVAAINVTGGFLVTRRMLKMFQRDDD